MSELPEAIREFMDGAFRQEAALIEEAAERILLSGTNWGIRVWRWLDESKLVIVAEATPEIRGIEFLVGPPPDETPVWRVCPNPDCRGGWVKHWSPTVGDDPRVCAVCRGRAWVDISK